MISALLALVCAVVGAQSPAPNLSIALPNKPNTVKFAAIGDSGTGTRAQYEVAGRMAEARQRFSYDFVIMLGDNVYGRQEPQDFVTKFERPYQALLDGGVTFYASLGNHDRQSNRFYPPWNMNGQRYYAFTKGHVRFFVLDSNDIDQRQADWLAGQLASAGDAWKVVYFHHPLYSSAGRHGSAASLQRVLEPMFIKYGVNVVLSGHDHTYERLTPQKGIYYFVSGSAGQLRRGNLRPTALTAAGFDQDNAFLLVEIDTDAMSIQALTRGGQTVDAVTLPRQGPTARR